MSDPYSFDEPLNREPDGTYITAAQMKFFLNRKNGPRLYEKRSDVFVEYYDICRVYNLISDILKTDEEAAIIYWDEAIDSLAMAFPDEGVAAQALDKIKPHCVIDDDDNEEEDPWGLLDDKPWRD
tara:strand:- start:2592 stop:2966 length:375 start_codon:yes stop_codon:yes gene_type:complete